MKLLLHSLSRLLAFVLVVQLHAAAAPKLFTEGVRVSEPLSPEQQQKTFHLPPGFKIQLVAAEPDLRKPMNMAFDSAGRLWLTESREYPFAATNAALARDTIRIFSDFDDNGRARKVTTFATNLNIPIGIYPFRSPAKSEIGNRKSEMTWKCLAWSIPHIWLFEDTDGDGVADQQEQFLGPFDFSRDTHGNQASFRRGPDGWVYATHGFNNQSRVSGTDGHAIFLPSGNVYRFRLDGSRIEHWTHGQVNPFGLAFDPLGNLYSADCHSSPIYQLLRSAHYPSFGRPHDGLGFAPTTIQHSHGSTAIGGIVHISDPSWPHEFQDNLFIGNVLTSRINRDQLTWRGSTSVGKEQPDFLSTDDPWFRPVDLQFGPDGALWVADFYNRIIGHYEVPLLHPGRDRDRGRLWRIVPPSVAAEVRRRTGDDAAKESASSPRRLPDFTRASRDALLNELLGQNPTRRALAREELALLPNANDHGLITQAAQGLWHFRQQDERAGLMTSCLWLLHRAGTLDEKTLLGVLQDRDEPIRVHALRILTERGLQAAETSARSGASAPASGVNAALLAALRTALNDKSAHVQRAAADALAANPHPDHLPQLLALQKRVPAEDTHLAHVVRMALREQLRQPGAFAKLSGEQLPPADARAFAALATSLTNAEAAAYLVRHVEAHSEPTEVLARYVTHAARYAPDADLPKLVAIGRKQFAADLDTQAAVFKAMLDGQAARADAAAAVAAEVRRRTGSDAPQESASSPQKIASLPQESASSPRRLLEQADLRAWGTDLAAQLLAPAAQPATWAYVPLDPAQPGRNPFAFEERTSADGQKTRLMSSFPHGETLTGVLRSPVFALPKQLSFYLSGHDGAPGQPAGGKNHVRLRLISDTDKAQLPTEKTPFSPRRAASLPLPAGEGRGEGESGLPPAAFSFTTKGHEGRRLEANPSRVELPAFLPHPSPLPLGEGTSSPALGHPQVELSPRRPASLPLPAGEGRGEGENVLPTAASGPLSLHRMRGEGWGEGFRAAAQVAPPLIRPAATFSPPPRKGEGERPPALGHSQRGSAPGRPEHASLLPFAFHLLPSLQSLPAGEGRGEGESSRGPAGFSFSQAVATGGQEECTPRQAGTLVGQAETPAERVESPAGRRRDAAQTRLALAPTRRDAAPTRRDAAPTRRDAAPTRRDAAPTRRGVDPTRLALAQTRPDAAQTRLGGDPTRRDVAQTRRDDVPTRRAEDSTRREAIPTRLAAAQAAGDLPKGVVREAKVPRSDIAQKITWDLADVAGKRAVIEVTDGDDGKAYAWLAFGRFAPALPELTLSEVQSLARRQQAGADLARSLKLATLEPVVAKLFTETTDATVRAAAGRAWLALNAAAALPQVEPLVRDAAQPEALRAELAAQLGEAAEARGLAVVVAALTNAPTRLQTRFATALVGTAAGAEQLLAAAESGRIAARLLQDRTLTDRLRASPARDASARLAALVQHLPAADVLLHKLIEAKRAGFDAKQANAGRGAEVFAKACAGCHLLAGQGALVGPQLDGIGGRGLERLLEDVLDPNRNVDKAFRTTVYVLKDGETVSGLHRREEGGAFIYALANGQEARVPKESVKERRETETSLMPANFIEALTAVELNDLLAFLLGKSGK